MEAIRLLLQQLEENIQETKIIIRAIEIEVLSEYEAIEMELAEVKSGK